MCRGMPPGESGPAGSNIEQEPAGAGGLNPLQLHPECSWFFDIPVPLTVLDCDPDPAKTRDCGEGRWVWAEHCTGQQRAALTRRSRDQLPTACAPVLYTCRYQLTRLEAVTRVAPGSGAINGAASLTPLGNQATNPIIVGAQGAQGAGALCRAGTGR